MLHRTPVGWTLASAAIVGLAVAIAGCRSQPPAEPLNLEGNMLTVVNQSKDDWSGVDIWLNHNHRVMVPSIKAGARLQVPLDSFVAGFGQRFDFHRTQVTDVRLTAKLPDGTPLELTMPFREGGLAGALGGKR